jgi:hypothetical protein
LIKKLHLNLGIFLSFSKHQNKNTMVDSTAKHALIIGATGATGKDVMELLLKDDFFSKVDIFVRRNIGVKHEKLTVHVIDFDNSEQWKDLVKGDIMFSCLGTTLKDAGSKQAQWKIDYEYQYEFAKAAKNNRVEKYVLVSSQGASAKSPFFYAKMKGQLEEAIKKLQFDYLSIFKPPILIRQNSKRAGEKIGIKIITIFNKIGLLLSLKPLPTNILAKAMTYAAKKNTNKITVFTIKEIMQSANEFST